MEIDYTYSFADYQALLKARQKRERAYRLGFAVFWLLLIINLGIGLWLIWIKLSSGEPLQWLDFINIGFAILLFLSRYVIGPWSTKRYFRKQMLEDMPIRFTVSEDGIQTRSETSEGKFKWTGILRVDNEPDHLIFWTSKVQGVSVPKSEIPPSAMQEIRNLVTANVSDHDLETETP